MSSASRADGAGRRRRVFRPGLGLTLGALVALAVLLALGTWQVQRLQWKTALVEERHERLAAEPVVLPPSGEALDWRAWDFRRVVIPDGQLLPEQAQRFGFKAEGGRPGHDLLVPLRRPDGGTLLVDLGFVPAAADGPASAEAGLEPPPVTGVLRYRGDDASPGWMTPDNRPAQRVWYWYDMPALRDATGLELLPVVLDASAEPAGVDLPNNHLQYAVTWYGLAAVLVAMYVAVGFARRKEER